MNPIPYNYVVIEGCIGAGKTSLAQRFAMDFNAELILERFADNSFLPKFYKDPLHYAFPVEMTFLTDRYQQLKTLLSQRDLFTDLVVSDYFIEKCVIFSKNNLQDDEYKLFTKIYDIISTHLPKPDLILYLYNDAEHLLQNIAKRGRDYEQNIGADYLNSIQESYLNHLKNSSNLSILMVEAKNLDFVENELDYTKLKKMLYHTYPKGITVVE
ncbi:MAG: deoxynucleoside kinase [Bacteroidales bacterium]|jgi:deoxyadenosine/deoxycytidine kinase|nr:deoxynucleoside kinase [Bacteroidales bacterium]